MNGHPLPIRIDPVDGQGLDTYLHAVGTANRLTVRELIHAITDLSGTPMYNGAASPFGYASHQEIMTAISTLTDQPPSVVASMTLQRYSPDSRTGPGTLLPWKPNKGINICPACVEENPFVRPVWWRLPHIATCPTHHIILNRICPRCHKAFRSNRSPALMPNLVQCDNQIEGFGTTVVTCGQSLTQLPAVPADAAECAVSADLLAIADGADQTACGTVLSGVDYLDSLSALTLLLTHLAATRADDRPWTETVVADAHARRGTRSRLSASPPQDMLARAQLLTAQTAILAKPTPDDAAAALVEHLTHIPEFTAGPLAWIASHTRLTPLMSQLTTKAVAPRRGISYQIRHRLPALTLPAEAIPQCIPQDWYDDHFPGTIAVLDITGRLYIALCCARRLPGVRNWNDAGRAIGIASSTTARTPLDCSAKLTVGYDAFIEAVNNLCAALDPDINYRERERTVTAMAATPQTWYPQWRTTHHERTHYDTGLANALEWHWQNWACAEPYTQPWSNDWIRARRYRYRQWEAKLEKST